jgi:pimeloyl-ACP methyl ester carboxylesterase
MIAPEWFIRALSAPRQSRSVVVEECAIHYLSWGDAKQPGLLFVAPMGGHAHWFAHVAPLFADQFHVAAIDLSGCGDSGRRETYAQELVTEEIAAVLAHSGMFEAQAPPTVVGHSAGAQCAVRAGVAHGENLLGIIAIDGLHHSPPEQGHASTMIAGLRSVQRPPRVYQDFEEAVARFRLMPKPYIPVGNDFIVENIARNSFRPVDGGWTSKFDTGQNCVFDLAMELTGSLKDLECRAASLFSEHSHVGDEIAAQTVSRINDGKVTALTIPGTSHYPQIDSPFAFVAVIKAIALGWQAELRRSLAK